MTALFNVTTIIYVKIEFDPAKNERNIRDRGISFELASGFDFDTALTIEDKRRDYGEPRYLSLGCIGSRLYALVFSPRGSVVRVISLRKANSREETKYAEQKTKPRAG